MSDEKSSGSAFVAILILLTWLAVIYVLVALGRYLWSLA